MTNVLSDNERLYRLRLIRSENVGPVTFRRLLERFGNASAALQALPELSRRGGQRRTITICTAASARREMDALATVGARLVANGEPDYPPLLAHIEDAPPLLAMFGDPRVAAGDSVAIVGARNASINGVRMAESLARDLGAAGVAVVSGLARGIDAAAHRAALATGTVAVVAGGIDVVYPPEHADLQRAIAERGVVISEMPPGVQPQARHFPRRNRLISGMSRGVIVVEAALRSGSLITARQALEQGRDVFAVPGSPLDARARGPNDLIRQGAVLTETVEDVLGALCIAAPPVRGVTVNEPPPLAPAAGPESISDTELDEARRSIADALSPAPAAVDEIIRRCRLSSFIVATVLLEWELAGRLERQPGGRVALIA
ncbi:MAG: DNA-protecting protein DprA [Rhodospirillales bacterium]|nr:DNA-protecting protein DprA [Rhodospirillales bacterium]